MLTAASALFAERGFDRTTTREIGDRAGVDPALIARYFQNKTGLYVAALHAELGQSPGTDLLDPSRFVALLDRTAQRGPGPVFRAAVQVHEDPDAHAATKAELHRRLVAPLTARFTQTRHAEPELRAEMVVAAFVGVLLARSAGTLEQLSAATPQTLLAVVGELLGMQVSGGEVNAAEAGDRAEHSHSSEPDAGG